jgi:hypothetical protein
LVARIAKRFMAKLMSAITARVRRFGQSQQRLGLFRVRPPSSPDLFTEACPAPSSAPSTGSGLDV